MLCGESSGRSDVVGYAILDVSENRSGYKEREKNGDEDVERDAIGTGRESAGERIATGIARHRERYLPIFLWPGRLLDLRIRDR